MERYELRGGGNLPCPSRRAPSKRPSTSRNRDGKGRRNPTPQRLEGTRDRAIHETRVCFPVRRCCANTACPAEACRFRRPVPVDVQKLVSLSMAPRAICRRLDIPILTYLLPDLALRLPF